MGIFAALFKEHRSAEKLPIVRERFESNVKGIHIIGDLAGSPVIKTSVNQGFEIIEMIAKELKDDSRRSDYDVVIIGAGAAGLSAGLRAKQRGLTYLILEQNRIANTIANFPKGKKIYAEPPGLEVKGDLWIQETTKEEFLRKWCDDVQQKDLNIKTKEEVIDIRRSDLFEVITDRESYWTKRVILAIGRAGNPRKLRIPGADKDKVVSLLIDPEAHQDEDVCVVGAGDVAAEAAVSLALNNRVTMLVRSDKIDRPSKRNKETLLSLADENKLTIHYNAEPLEITDSEIRFSVDDKEQTITNSLVCAMIGRELPVRFLSKIGIKLENTWTAGRFAWLAVWIVVAYAIYGIKSHLPPFNLLPPDTYTLINQSPSFWYSFAYSALMVGFGIPAMIRWGKMDRIQYWRFASLIAFQVIALFIVPYIIFGIILAQQNPMWADEAWRVSGVVLAWPLFFNTFFDSPPKFFIYWGVILSFVVIPIFTYFHGKRYCSWICSCGGLAETFGDRWRHLAPKGVKADHWELMSWVIFWIAAVFTVIILTDFSFIVEPIQYKNFYGLFIDTYLAGVFGIGLYPFFGSRMWCRYWCPLQIYMQKLSKWFGQFHISSNDKCITCGHCTRYCEMGIDVMSFAKNQKPFSNKETSCIGCGICIAVCPMDVLKVGPQPARTDDASEHNVQNA